VSEPTQKAGLRVVGAGLGRTGTHSLKLALEQLLGAPCYHMVEVFGHPEHVALWHAAMRGEPVDWPAVFDGYVATVDWPGGGVWRELMAAYPDALVLLSTRSSAEEWWNSADRTIFEPFRGKALGERNPAWEAMASDMLGLRFTPDFLDAEAAKAAYDSHNEAVRAAVPPERLVEHQPGDGWGPLCAALGVPVPDEPYPRTNTTAEFRERAGWD
jgi:hypothetical protein